MFRFRLILQPEFLGFPNFFPEFSRVSSPLGLQVVLGAEEVADFNASMQALGGEAWGRCLRLLEEVLQRRRRGSQDGGFFAG